jgi:hypothetical protein
MTASKRFTDRRPPQRSNFRVDGKLCSLILAQADDGGKPRPSPRSPGGERALKRHVYPEPGSSIGKTYFFVPSGRCYRDRVRKSASAQTAKGPARRYFP